MFVLQLLILSLIAFCCYIYWFQKFSDRAKKIAKFRSFEGYIPVIGHVWKFSLNQEKLYIEVREMLKQFNETFSVWGGLYSTLHVITPDDAEIVFTEMDAIQKGTTYYSLQPWLGTGLLLSTGSKWHKRRKILTPAFHFTILQRFIPIFNKYSLKLVEKLKHECENDKTDIKPLLSDVALSTICETSMGINLEDSEENKKKYFSSIYKYAYLYVERIIRIWYHSDFIYNLSPSSRVQAKVVDILHKFTSNLIKHRENERLINKKTEETKKAMLDLLLEEKEKGNIDSDGIQEEVDTFIFEGHDTISIALSFLLMCLANHKDIQDKVMVELNEIFGDSQREATFSDLQNMKYLECCLKETMRLYPSVPIILRIPSKDIALTKNVAPAGGDIFIHINELHRIPKYFPDPEKFDPERFLPENSRGRHPFVYVPFSAGPRNCIGQKYAMLELKVFVSTILRNFILEPVQKPEDLTFLVDLVLRVKGPMYVKFIQRK